MTKKMQVITQKVVYDMFKDILPIPVEYVEKTGICCMCGKAIEPTFTAPVLIEQDLCSWRCWAELYGEEG
jgi:hypothetical protein